MAIYYAGFDPGSGNASLKLMATGVYRPAGQLTMDSCVAAGSADDLLARGDINARLADVIRSDETFIHFNSRDYYLESLVREGRNPTYEFGNPERYWGDHTKVLLFSLASNLIDDRNYTLRLVTALPVTLYGRENRRRVKEALTGTFPYSFNGEAREATIEVGYVAMEGQGALISAGLPAGAQALIDIGERTTDFVRADGQKLVIPECRGNATLGVHLIVDALDKMFRRYGRVFEVAELHKMLRQYTKEGSIDPVLDASGTAIDGSVITACIRKASHTLATEIAAYAGSIWNREGEQVGLRFNQITIAGGGAHYAGVGLAHELPHVVVPQNPEDLNMSGYLDLALSLEDKLPGVWSESEVA